MKPWELESLSVPQGMNPMRSDCKYIQYDLLNLSMGDKQYGMFIIYNNIYKENMKLHMHIPCTCTFMIQICTHIYGNTGQERIF